MSIAAVCVSTGTQGISVTKALSQAGYTVRALTRDPAKAADVFKGFSNVVPTFFDINDRGSVQAAFDGASIVFGMTYPDFKEAISPAGTYVKPEGALDEYEQGTILADVAKEKDVKVFLWSSIEAHNGYDKLAALQVAGPRRIRMQAYIESIGLPAVFLALPVFNENLIKQHRLALNDAGELVYTLPYAQEDSQYAHGSIDPDLGRIVAFVVQHFEGAKLNHRTLRCAEGIYTPSEIVSILQKVTSRKVVFQAPASFPGLPPGCAIDVLYQTMARLPYMPREGVPDSTLAELGFRFETLEEYVRREVVPALKL